MHASSDASLLDGLTKKILRPDEWISFEAEMKAATEGERDPLLREIRRQALLVEVLALRRLGISEEPYRTCGPSDEVREQAFSQAMTLLRLFQQQTEGIRRWKALPEGSTTINQLIVQGAGNQDGKNDREVVCDAEVVQEGPSPDRQLECDQDGVACGKED